MGRTKKGWIAPHTDFIIRLYQQGLKPWQIRLWEPRWRPEYIAGVLENARKRGDARAASRNYPRRCITLEEFMQHHFYYIEGTEYQCLRCKRRGEKEEINQIKCDVVETDYKKPGRPRKISPEERLERGKRWVQPKNR